MILIVTESHIVLPQSEFTHLRLIVRDGHGIKAKSLHSQTGAFGGRVRWWNRVELCALLARFGVDDVGCVLVLCYCLNCGFNLSLSESASLSLWVIANYRTLTLTNHVIRRFFVFSIDICD